MIFNVPWLVIAHYKSKNIYRTVSCNAYSVIHKLSKCGIPIEGHLMMTTNLYIYFALQFLFVYWVFCFKLCQ